MNAQVRGVTRAAQLVLVVAMALTVCQANSWATPTVAIVVNSDLKPSIQTGLAIYEQDLISDGYDVVITPWDSPDDLASAAQLRAHLGSLRPSLTGAVLIGQLPRAGYWDHTGEGWAFATDIFYMDFAAAWTDTNGNGFFDSVSQDLVPEIWVSRLNATNLDPALFGLTTEADLINSYLQKNHDFRTDPSFRLPDRALVYMDSADVPDDLPQAYNDCTIVDNDRLTTAADYINHWPVGYESIVLGTDHAYFDRHDFRRRANGHQQGHISSATVAAGDPKAHFMYLATPVAMAPGAVNGIGACYVFAPSSGLLAVGSSYENVIRDKDEYYQALAGGGTHGEAFQALLAANSAATPENIEYAYGMAMVGDGTLRLGRFIGGVNQEPMAQDDSYSVPADTTLVVDAPGVLVNDSDPNGDPISALWYGGPAYGTLDYLNLDGSFMYVPNPGYEGDDSFSYTAVDGALESNIATVTVTVGGASDPGGITGIVTDSSGRAVKKATVTAYDLTGPVATKSTNPKGKYTFTGLSPGPYTVVAEKNGLSGSITATVVSGQTTADVDIAIE